MRFRGENDNSDSSANGILVKYVRSGDTFPATRADGSPLVLGDYLKPTGTLPFTIGTVTFTDYKDQAVWTGVEWLYNANAFQKTNETPVADKTAESVSGTANYQSQINAENRTEILARVKQVATMPAPTAAMIGKPCVQYVGNSTTAFTHNRFYEAVADGSSVKWQECQVSEGGSPPTYLKTARITTSGDLVIKKNTGETLTFSCGGETSDDYWEEL